MSEAQFWKNVRRAWPGHAVRIEASRGDAEEGTPDCVLSIGGRGLWIELKVWPEKLRPAQLAWHLDGIARGAGAWVLCSFGKRGVWFGRAPQYELLCQVGRRPEKLGHLQAVLEGIVCRLISRA